MRPRQLPKRKDNPSRANDSGEMLLRMAEQFIESNIRTYRSGYAEAILLAQIFGVGTRYFIEWAKTKKIRRYKQSFNVHDLADVLLPAVRGIENKLGVHGNWETWGTLFCLGEYEVFLAQPPAPIYITAKLQKDDAIWWTVSAYLEPCWVLTRELDWVYEPEPEKRKIAYIRQTRYKTKEEALDHFYRFMESVEMIGEYDLNNQKQEHE